MKRTICEYEVDGVSQETMYRIAGRMTMAEFLVTGRSTLVLDGNGKPRYNLYLHVYGDQPDQAWFEKVVREELTIARQIPLEVS
jgi:hypothetical protein